MSIHIEPCLAEIGELHPTQITVGMGEVRRKRNHFHEMLRGKDVGARLGAILVPVVIGPCGRLFVIDHHHLCLALSLIDQEHVSTRTEADLSSLPDKRFWAFMDARGWCHPYDERGQRKSFAAIPERLTDLVDDPYRGLAGELRRAGGCAKEPAPFSEFLWADFLRDKVPSELLRDDFEAAIQLAQAVAKTDEASYLPGWCGPHGSAQ